MVVALCAVAACSDDDDDGQMAASTGAPGSSSSSAGGGEGAAGGDGGAATNVGGSGGVAGSGGSASGGAGGTGGDPGAGGSGGDGSGGAGGDGGSAPFTGASGPITGVVPAAADVMVAWVVSAGSPDYSYNFGDGSIAGATFMVGFDTDPPPADALNNGTLGVGIVVLVQAGMKPPPGEIVDFDGLEAITLGASESHAIIYRTSAANMGWPATFPLGYSCGVCVPANMGFDSFEPVSCDQVEVVGGTFQSLDFCNWT
jgi:hypothetical protein